MLSRPMILITLLSFLWGSEWLASMELSDLPHLRVIALRCLVAAIVLLPFALQKKTGPKLDYGRNALLGIGLIAIPVILSALATNISSGLAVVLFAAIPLIATLIESGGQGSQRHRGRALPAGWPAWHRFPRARLALLFVDARSVHTMDSTLHPLGSRLHGEGEAVASRAKYRRCHSGPDAVRRCDDWLLQLRARGPLPAPGVSAR